jgi:formyltetrahydrofolate synthetase
VEYSERARADLRACRELGLSGLPVCMAKTQYSLSHDPSLKGAPRGFILPVQSLRISAGAGFVTPMCGDISTMPGLPSRPAYLDMDIDVENGRVRGLF